MEEADFRQQMYKTLRLMGYWPIRGRDATVCPRCHTKLLPPIGRPDILILNPNGLDLVLETKSVAAGETSFSFSEISEDQRKWLNRWMSEGGFGYVGIGYAKRPSRLWIFDWATWIDIEKAVRLYQLSIPVDISTMGKCLKVLKDNNIDLVHLGSQHEMKRKDDHWEFPQDHSIVQLKAIKL